MIPPRLSFMTCNLWLTERWPARAPALARLLDLFMPDVLCVQELQRATREFLDAQLHDHRRVDDPFPGWTNEGNIYWNRAIFERIEHGAEDVGHQEPERRLFWARLRVTDVRRSILVATAHLPSPRRGAEKDTGLSPRVGQLQRIAAALAALGADGEPAFFMGDMNDPWHPQHILKQAGFVSCFAALGLQSPPTFQCYPTVNIEPGEQTTTAAIDLIVANRAARPIAASVPHCYAGDLAPSDHWPVLAIYQLE